jgi:hypothetical protein
MSRYNIETLHSICNELGYLFQINKPNSDGVGETVVKTKVNKYSVWSHNADWACKKLLDKIIEIRDGRVWVKEDRKYYKGIK